MLGLDVGAGQQIDFEIVAQRLAPLALDRLALARGKRGEKVVEVAIALVDEMELLAGAQDEAGAAQGFGVGLIAEGDVDRGGVQRLAQRAPAGDQRFARAGRRVGGDQQTPAGDRREGRGDLQLGIIVAAGALIGVGPGVVEDIFALAVRLEIGRRGGDEAAARVFDQHMRRRPARAAADRAGVLRAR